ncbi:MAG: threonine synthase [Candidatus Bipolaricaulia bacterium]
MIVAQKEEKSFSMKKIGFKLAMGQMLVEGGAVSQNLKRATNMIKNAIEQDCNMVVLPECLDVGWTYPGARELAQPIPGKYSDELCHAAHEARIYVVAGLTERAGDRIYNAAVLISPDGEILLKHRKINILTIAQDIYSIGDSLSVAQTPLGTIGINICADNFPDSLSLGHSLVRMGAQILPSPSAWAVDADHDNNKDPYGDMWKKSYATLAKRYDITVVGVSNVGWINAGVWKGRKCIGCSLAIGPEGDILAEGPYGETAESLIVVPVEIVQRDIMGTAIAAMLKDKGYEGQKRMISYLTHLECSQCGKRFDPNRLNTVCDDCGKPLLSRYDLKALSETWHHEDLLGREPTMWRYRELLPVQDEQKIVSLGETMTPLVHARRLGAQLGLEQLWGKDETRLPTGTFKARGLAMGVSRAVELGVTCVAMPSAGNAAEALSVYAARAGLECYVFMPKDALLANQRVCQAAGAHLYLVDGLISDAGRIVREGSDTCGWFDLSTFREPYRVEGKKTMGLELAEQLGWTLPDVIVYPTGGGTGLVGMWKAFAELEALGWIDAKRPRMVSVQAAGCAPVVRAFESGADEAEFWEGASTIAGGLRVPYPLADRLILKAVRDSDGTVVAVTDEAILEAMTWLSQTEGLLASPEGAATVAAVNQLVRSDQIQPYERVVLFNCGTMLKHLDLLEGPTPPVLDPKGKIDYRALIQG